MKVVQMEWEEPAVCAGPLLKVRLCEPGERLTFTAPAQSIKKSNQRMFARIPNQIMSDERSPGFICNLLGWGTNSGIKSLIGEHVNVCAMPHSLKDSSAHLSRSSPGNLNKSIFSNILQVNKPSHLTGEFYTTNLKVCFFSFWTEAVAV